MIVVINSYFFLTKKSVQKEHIYKMIVVRNWLTQDHFSKVSIYNFLGQKNMKKGYMEIPKKFTLRPLRSVLGWTISHYFQQPPLKVEVLSNPRILKIWLEVQPPIPRHQKGAHYESIHIDSRFIGCT